MFRLFGIALAIINSQDGILLIDEVDSGLHYSIQEKFWNFIFQVSEKHNVQVFATTHSWDCLEAFQKAACRFRDSRGMLVRLERKHGDIIPTLFDEKQLQIATREQIEIR